MSKLISPGQCRMAIQICAASAVAALLSGCSSDAYRFNDPFSNPFATGSIAKPKHVASTKATGTGRAPPVVAQALPPKSTTVASAAPVRHPAPAVSNETTGSIESAPVASVAGWSSKGGATVTIAQGETAEILSKRYGVPQNVLLQINGLHGASELQPGSRITLPVYNAVATAGNVQPPAHVAAAPPAHPVSVASPRVAIASPAVESHRAKPESRTAAAPPPAKLAKAEPKAKVVAAVPAPAAVAAHGKVVAAVPARMLKGAAAVKTAAIEPAVKAKPAPAPHVAKPVAVAAKAVAAPKAEQTAEAAPSKAVDPAPTASVAPAAAEAAGPEFRWPARGRIIQSFKGGAGGNDGINIAVPEGTAVKAAEGGVVAYAGSELKGYGNMVLIRHPNGFVSAYANNAEIDVKKGDTVKRGQTIAKSGQTGNVASPQLHFELRKGAQPVDPTAYLAGL